MTVTFLREARSSATKRPSRRSRPAASETFVEAGRKRGAARGVVATRVIFARRGRIARTDRTARLPRTKPDSSRATSRTHGLESRPRGLARPGNHQHLVMAAHLDRGDRGIR